MLDAPDQADLFQQTPSPPRPHAPFIRGSDTSKAAAEFVEPRLGPMEKVVYDFIKAQPHGATCEEIEKGTGLKHQTASPRMIALGPGNERYPGKKLIYDTGERRPSESGVPAAVWKAKS